MMQPHRYTNHHPSYLEVDHALTSCCIHIIWAKKVKNSNYLSMRCEIIYHRKYWHTY